MRGENAGLSLAERIATAVKAILEEVVRGDKERPRQGHEPWASPIALGAAYEQLLMLRPKLVAGELEFKLERAGGHARRQRGAYYTPAWLVARVLDAALEPVMAEMGESRLMTLRVLDPACGSGHFLVAAAERIARRLAVARGHTKSSQKDQRDATKCVFGMDSDPVAVALCRAAIGNAGSQVMTSDGLLDAPPGGEKSFDVVIGNPPFLNRLEKRTAVGGAAAARLKEKFGSAALAYTDVSALFLLRAVELVRDGGRAALVLPQSILTSRDATGVRRRIMRLGTLTDIWLADEHYFDASVFVCVPTVLVGGKEQGPVTRRRGIETLKPATINVPGMEADSWGSLGGGEGPEIDIAALSTQGTIGELAEVTADFRDEYYGLRGMVVEDSTLSNRAHFPALVTTGLIDPARCLWGVVACRFCGARFESPRVDLRRLKRQTDLGKWATARLRPKLLLATQTRVLETAVDEHGRWLPVTPLISITPRNEADLWRIGAALSSPVITAIAMQMSAGAALTKDAIKLSATQVRTLPMPPDDRDSYSAADLFKKASFAKDTQRPALLERGALASCRSFGLDENQARELTTWWRGRAAKRL